MNSIIFKYIKEYVVQYKFELFSVVICATVLLRILENDFVWDDTFLLQHHTFNRAHSLAEILFRPFWQNASFSASSIPPYWRPLPTFIFWSLTQIRQNDASLFHFTSLLGVVFASCSLALFVKSVFPSLTRGHIWCGLIYLIHPITTEITCMATNISDHLALGLILCAGTAAIKFILSKRKFYIFKYSIFILLSCFSKEFGVGAIGLPIIAWMATNHFHHAGLTNRYQTASLMIASIIPIGIFFIARHYVLQHAVQHGSIFFEYDFLISFPVLLLSIGQFFWQCLLVSPKGAHLYVATSHLFPWIISYATAAGLIGMLIYSWRKNALRTTTTLLLGAIVLFFPSVYTVITDDTNIIIPIRYFHIGVAGIVASLSSHIDRISHSMMRFTLPLIIIFLCTLSFIRIREWENEVTFYSAEASHHPNSISDLENATEAYIQNRQYAAAEKLILQFENNRDDISRLENAIVLSIKSKLFYYRYQDIDTATQTIQRSLQIQPSNLNNVFWLAHLRFLAGRPNEAIMVLTDALDMPWYTNLHKIKIKQKIREYKQHTVQ